MSIKGQGHSLALAKSRSVFKLNSSSSKKTVGLFETEYYVEARGSTGVKIDTNGAGQMTKMAAMPIYGKNP